MNFGIIPIIERQERIVADQTENRIRQFAEEQDATVCRADIYAKSTVANAFLGELPPPPPQVGAQSSARTAASALEWLADATGSDIAYSGSVSVDSGESEIDKNRPKTLSYVGGYAETDPDAKNRYVDLTPPTSGASPFAYFMDGSRMAWKVAEFLHDGKLWPIVAGQVGVAFCQRRNRRIVADSSSRKYRTVLSIPNAICGFGVNEADNGRRIKECLNGINARLGWGCKNPFDEVLTYADDDDDKTNLAVSRIQALMVATEKQLIFELAEAGRLSDGEYLVKDGSLEYRDDVISKLKWKDLEGRLQYVVGVSKSFNADLFEVKVKSQKQSAASFISRLGVNQRTQAFRYEPHGHGSGPKFAVWYVRIRDQRLGRSAFDGVVKVEMLLIGNEGRIGKSSLEIDRISEGLIRERNPVCYGADSRWANHIYPIFLTEKYLKSGFLSGHVFRAMTSQGKVKQ